MSSHAQTLRSGVPQIGRQHACWPGTAAGEPPGVPEAPAAVGRAAQEAGPAGAPQGWRAGVTGPARRGVTLLRLLTFQGRGVGFRQVWRQHGLCMDHVERRGAPQSPLSIVGRRDSARPIAVFASAEDDFCRQRTILAFSSMIFYFAALRTCGPPRSRATRWPIGLPFHNINFNRGVVQSRRCALGSP
jgi:hypothetical protein